MKVKFLTILTITCMAFLVACGGKSDEDLQKAVAAKLASDNVSGVTVAVKGGAATLTGEVADITVRNKAESSAKGVEGIKSVDASGVRMRPVATPAAAPADPMLRGKVEENLKKAGCTGATVEIASGTVTLRGTVPDAKYAECIKVVNESGAGKLDNQLQRGK